MSYPKPYWSQILGTQASGRSALGLAAIAASGSYADLSNTPAFGSLAFANGVTLAQLPVINSNTILGNATGGATTPTALTVVQTKALLAIAASDVSGLGSLATLNAAPAGTLTGTALNPTVTTSSLTSVGVLSSGSAASGFTVADSCLTSNVALKNAANTFTNANTIAVSSPAMVNLILQGAASQASDLMQFQNSTGAVLSAFKNNGNLSVGIATAPKGTGNQKVEIAGTGTGAAAFGSLALSRADQTSSSVVGSIDFYTVTTLAAQILVNQVGGGAGGINYISFNLGSAGTMVTPMQLRYASGSSLGSLYLGATNGTLQGKFLVYNYSNGAVTTGLTLSNPVSSGGTGGCQLAWIDGAGGNTIGSIRAHYMSAAGVGDMIISVGTGTTDGLQDFVRLTSGNRVDFYLLDSVANKVAASIVPSWNANTDATRAGQLNFGTYYITTFQTGISIVSNSVSVQLGFYGATPISRPTASLVTTGYTAGSSTAMTIDGKSTGGVGATAYTFGDLIASLKNLGFLAA